ncbi:hypothetical protein D3C76_1010430 [compost metagenome]
MSQEALSRWESKRASNWPSVWLVVLSSLRPACRVTSQISEGLKRARPPASSWRLSALALWPPNGWKKPNWSMSS